MCDRCKKFCRRSSVAETVLIVMYEDILRCWWSTPYPYCWLEQKKSACSRKVWTFWKQVILKVPSSLPRKYLCQDDWQRWVRIGESSGEHSFKTIGVMQSSPADLLVKHTTLIITDLFWDVTAFTSTSLKPRISFERLESFRGDFVFNMIMHCHILLRPLQPFANCATRFFPIFLNLCCNDFIKVL